MNLYEVLSKYTKRDSYRCAIFQDEGKGELDTERDVAVFELLKNVSNIGAKITLKDISFGPAIEWEGKRSFGPQDISESDYMTLKSLDMDQIPDYIRCRLADLLWVEQKYYPAAKVAAATYLELFKETFSEERWVRSIQLLYRAVCISLQINCQTICEETRQLICKYLKRADEEGNDSLSISFIEILVEQKLSDDDLALPILDKMISKTAVPIQRIERAYQLKLKCLEWKKSGSDNIKSVNKAFAQRYETESERHNASTFPDISVMIDLLRKAVILYRNNGESEEAQRVQRRITELQGKLPKMLSSIVNGYDVSKLHQYLVDCFDGLSFAEGVILIAQFTVFRKKDDVKNALLQKLHDYPLQLLSSKRFMNEKGQTVLQLHPLDMKNPDGDTKLFNAHLHRELYDMEVIDGNLILLRALEILRNNCAFSIEDLDFLIKDNAMIPKGRERIFQSALYMALQGDYYEAVHILAPQVENLFRNLAEELGALTATFEDDGTSQAKVLSSVFELPELIDAYDNDILFIFEGLLNERAGANIRNEVAHGLLEEPFACSGVCIYFICAVLKLLIFTSPGCNEVYRASDRLKVIKVPQEDISPVPVKNYK